MVSAVLRGGRAPAAQHPTFRAYEERSPSCRGPPKNTLSFPCLPLGLTISLAQRKVGWGWDGQGWGWGPLLPKEVFSESPSLWSFQRQNRVLSSI